MNRSVLLATLLVFVMLSWTAAVQAKDVPSDPCQLLPSAQLSKALGLTFGEPARSTAPAPFRGNVPGTDCTYSTGGERSQELLFRIYVDQTPAVAKTTHDQLSTWYAPNRPVTGAWDAAYLDPKHAIHVLKGKVRYYLDYSASSRDAAKYEKELSDLAAAIAAQL